MTAGLFLEVEATGETVGEAKWNALRELEQMQPGVDRDAVVFEVLSEGARGLLGVGTSPARVLARVPQTESRPQVQVVGDSELAGLVRGLLERIAHALDLRCRIEVTETEDSVTGTYVGSDLALAIGRHGRTIDAIQHLVSAIAHRRSPVATKTCLVDAAGYRARREARLVALAVRSAQDVAARNRSVELEPMSAVERKIIHLHLRDVPGIETRSEGEEPYRYVVIAPAATDET